MNYGISIEIKIISNSYIYKCFVCTFRNSMGTLDTWSSKLGERSPMYNGSFPFPRTRGESHKWKHILKQLEPDTCSQNLVTTRIAREPRQPVKTWPPTITDSSSRFSSCSPCSIPDAGIIKRFRSVESSWRRSPTVDFERTERSESVHDFQSRTNCCS